MMDADKVNPSTEATDDDGTNRMDAVVNADTSRNIVRHITVEILEGRHLPAADSDGMSDPYCELFLHDVNAPGEGVKIGETETKLSTLHVRCRRLSVYRRRRRHPFVVVLFSCGTSASSCSLGVRTDTTLCSHRFHCSLNGTSHSKRR